MFDPEKKKKNSTDLDAHERVFSIKLKFKGRIHFPKGLRQWGAIQTSLAHLTNLVITHTHCC